MIACLTKNCEARARKSTGLCPECEADERNIVIEIENGCVIGVGGLPDGWSFTIDDRDES